MPLNHISSSSLAALHRKLESRSRRDEKEKAQGEHIAGTLVRSGEVFAGALAMGTYAGRFPSKLSIGPVPVALGVAGLLHLAGFMGWAGKVSEHVHAVGDGVLGFYGTTLGAGLGTNLLVKAGGTPFAATTATKTSGFGSLGSGYRPGGPQAFRRALTPAEVHHFAQQRRTAGVHQAGVRAVPMG